MRFTPLGLALPWALLIAGCSDPGNGNPPPPPLAPSLSAHIAASGATPAPIEWIELVGAVGDARFDRSFDGSNGLGHDLPLAAADPGSKAYGVVLAGPSDGSAVAQAFATTTTGAGSEGGMLRFELGGDLLAGAILPASPAPSDGPQLTLDATVLRFQVTETEPASAKLVITNSGHAATGTVHVQAVGPAHGAFTVEGCAGYQLAPATACTVTVGLAPTSRTGTQLAVLVIDAGDGVMQTAILVGKSARDPNLAFEKSLLDFGTVEVGGALGTAAVVLRNDGGTDSSPVAVTIEGEDRQSFELNAGGCLDVAYAAGKRCAIGVLFTPRREGAHQAQLVARAQHGGTVAIPLTAVGHVPVTVSITGSGELNTLERGMTHAIDFKVHNDASAATGAISFAIEPADNAFVFAQPDGCGQGRTLSAGETCTVHVIARGDVDGKHAATLVVRANPGGTVRLPLSSTVDHFIELWADGQRIYRDYMYPQSRIFTQGYYAPVEIRNVSRYSIVPFQVANTPYDFVEVPVDAGTCVTVPGGLLGPDRSCFFFLTPKKVQSYGYSSHNYYSFVAAGDWTLITGAWWASLQVDTPELHLAKGQEGDVVLSNKDATPGLTPTVALSSSDFAIVANDCTGPFVGAGSCTVRLRNVTGSSATLTVSAPGQGKFDVSLDSNVR